MDILKLIFELIHDLETYEDNLKTKEEILKFRLLKYKLVNIWEILKDKK